MGTKCDRLPSLSVNFFEVQIFDHFWGLFGVLTIKILKKCFLGVFSPEKSFAPTFNYFKPYLLRKIDIFGLRFRPSTPLHGIFFRNFFKSKILIWAMYICLLYTSDAADE